MTNAVDFTPPTGSLHFGQPFRFDFQVRSSGDLVDADSEPTITITDASGTEVVIAQSTTRDATGLYHYDYTISAAGPGGVWLIELNYEYLAEAQETKHNFSVRDKVIFDPSGITTLDVPTVRWICRQIPVAIVPDEAIQIYIFESNAYIEGVKNSSATAQYVLLAKVFDVAVMAFANYISQIQEQVAAITLEEARAFQSELKRRRERWMDLIIGMTSTSVSFTSKVPARSSGSISNVRLGKPST